MRLKIYKLSKIMKYYKISLGSESFVRKGHGFYKRKFNVR